MRSTTEQHAENTRAAERRGVRLLDPYREAKAVGASRHSRGRRDGFAQLLDDLTTGAFGADELWLWEHSRGSRMVDEWVALVDACERAGVHVWITTHARVYNPANARDRRSLLEDAVDSAYESDKLSERSLRAARANAEAGHPHGKHLYGYRREYDPKTKALLRVVPDETAAPIVAELFTRFADGTGPTALAWDLTARGVATPGKSHVWRHRTIRNMLANESYLGHRVSSAGHPRVDNAWPALVDELTWRRCKARLDGRASTPGHAARHLLSGLIRCGVPGCTASMTYHLGRVRDAAPKPTYVCVDRSHNSRNATGLERDVLGLVFGMWEDEDRVRRAAGDGGELAKLEAEHAELVDQLREWQESAGDDGVSPIAVRAAERKLQPRIDEAERRLDAARARGLLPVVDGPLREQWDGLSLAKQRDIIAASVEIVVLPVGRGRRYSSDSVQITPRW